MSPTLEIKNNNEKKRPITTSLVGVPSDSVKFETDNQQTTTPKKPRGLGSAIMDDSPLPAFSPEQQKLLIRGLNLQEAESLDAIGRLSYSIASVACRAKLESHSFTFFHFYQTVFNDSRDKVSGFMHSEHSSAANHDLTAFLPFYLRHKRIFLSKAAKLTYQKHPLSDLDQFSRVSRRHGHPTLTSSEGTGLVKILSAFFWNRPVNNNDFF